MQLEKDFTPWSPVHGTKCNSWGYLSFILHGNWRRKWQSTPVLLPGKSHGRRSLIGYTVHGVAKSCKDMTSLSLSLCMVMGQGWYSLWYCCCAREILYKNKEAAVHRKSCFTLLERTSVALCAPDSPSRKSKRQTVGWGRRESERHTQNTEWACMGLSSPLPSFTSSQGVALVWLPGLYQCSKVLSALLFLSPQPHALVTEWKMDHPSPSCSVGLSWATATDFCQGPQ